MQFWKLSAFTLYIGSYLPLSLILLAQDLDLQVMSSGLCSRTEFARADCQLPLQHPVWSISACVIALLCMLASLAALRLVKPKHRITVIESKHIPADLINYVIPYVLSFVSLDFASPTKLIGFAVFFLWIFWITYRSGQIIMNPILIVFGWRLYEVKFQYLQSQDTLTGRALSRVDVDAIEF